MGEAVRPAVAVARIRALAASRGVSLEDLTASATAAVAKGRGSEGQYDGELDERLGGELARAVLEQERTQGRAAARLQ